MQLPEDSFPNAEQVAAYLRKHPQFFEHHAALLTELYLPSPHGSGTVSLAERQQLTQRDRIRVLEAKVAEFLQYGRENDQISEKVHRLSLGLLAAPDLEVLLQLLMQDLRDSFSVPYSGLRLWVKPRDSKDADNEVFREVDAELRSWTQGLVDPYCGHRPGLELDSWFGAGASPKSFALIALRGENVIGLLAIASDDDKRFHPEMGTQYLTRIGELVSAALLRYVAQ
ncbi:MAG: DUF484 family protein [Methylophilaceae bacterium]|jgi:uncharacterized protein YigA (DUF484 family)|nr:DUF484 family protein [Methylophilaceae bacterium]